LGCQVESSQLSAKKAKQEKWFFLSRYALMADCFFT
jgi:hypothetical protein